MNLTFSKGIKVFLARDFASFAIVAERFHFVWVAVVAGPLSVRRLSGLSVSRAWGLQTFHFACLLCLFVSGAGIAAWIAQRLRSRRVSALSLILLLSSAIEAIIRRTLGDFYWAFSRAYFLD